jgi:hypothetical protein
MVAVLKPRIIVSVTRTRWNLETQMRVCDVVVAAVCGCEWRYPNATADTPCAARRVCGYDTRGSHFVIVNAIAYIPISVLTLPIVILPPPISRNTARTGTARPLRSSLPTVDTAVRYCTR